MWQDLDGLGGAGVNSGAHQVDQFCATELTPEEQKILIDIRRKKTELLLAIQVSQLPYFTKPFYPRPRFPARIRACREKTFPAVLSSAGCRYSVFRMHCSLTNFIIDFDRNFHSAR